MSSTREMIRDFWDLTEILHSVDLAAELRAGGLNFCDLGGDILASKLCPFCTHVALFLEPNILLLDKSDGLFHCTKCETEGDFIDLMASVFFKGQKMRYARKLISVTSKLGIAPNLPKGSYRDKKGRKFVIDKVILGEINRVPEWFVVYKSVEWSDWKIMSLMDFFESFGSVRIRRFVPE